MTAIAAPRPPRRRTAVLRCATASGDRLEHRDDSGQAMVIVVVLLVLLATLAPVMAGQVVSDTPLLNSSASKHAALAAAEAGIQWYRDNLDTYSAYYLYSASNPPPTPDPAMAGFCGAGQVFDL